MITFQKYVKAETLEEAYTLNQAKNNRIIGGMLWLRLGLEITDMSNKISGLFASTCVVSDEAGKIQNIADAVRARLNDLNN